MQYLIVIFVIIILLYCLYKFYQNSQEPQIKVEGQINISETDSSIDSKSLDNISLESFSSLDSLFDEFKK